MNNNLMFFCIPQQAYMCTDNCRKLRKRPVGKVPAGAQPKLRACEDCTMYPLVDSSRVPTVSLGDYLSGGRPKAVNLNAANNKKLMEEELEREAV